MITWKEIKYFLGLSKLSPELISLWKEREEINTAKGYFEEYIIPSLISEGYSVVPGFHLSNGTTDKLIAIAEKSGLKTQFSEKNGSLLISLEEVPKDAVQAW